MKLKRWFSLVLTMCMMVSLIPCTVARADNNVEWEYRLQVQISDASDSKSKNGNIRAHLFFNMTDDEQFTVANTKKTGVLSETNYTSSRAPWTLDYFSLENTSKDGFKILWISLYVKKKGSSTEYCLINKHYPNGTGKKDGTWIEKEKKRPYIYKLTLWPERNINSVGNFDNLGGTIYLNPSGESGTVNYEYDGKVSDQYNGTVGSTPYYCMDMSAAPTFSYTVSGNGERVSLNKKTLSKNGISENSSGRGFTIDKSKLLTYMNNNNINKITVSLKVEFPSGSVTSKSGKTREKTLTIIRNSFSVGSVGFSTNYYIPTTSNASYNNDNRFYNTTIKNNNKNEIVVTVNIKSGGFNDNLTSSNLKNATLSFDDATLTLGNTGKKISLGKQSVSVKNGVVNLTFPYSSGMDSKNGGLKLDFNNAELKTSNYSQKLRLWNESDHKLGYSYYSSVNKLDALNPTVKLAPTNGSKVETWNKTITLSSTPSETIDIANGKTLKEGHYTMELYDENNKVVKIYDYTGGGSAGTSQNVPAAESFATNLKLSLAEKKEGIFTLKLSGQDKAGNKLSQSLGNIHLDNKAPEITVTEECGLPQSNGKKGNKYKITIKDASGTGKFYYCFTNDRSKAPAFDKSKAEQQKSGIITSTLNKWAYIDQSDTENGKTAAAYIEVDEGSNFSGSLIYFAEDAFGNNTGTSYKNITIINETTKCSIDTTTDTSIPRSSYNIVLTSNSQNTLYYRWQDSKGNYITDFEKYNGSGIDTASNSKTAKLDGKYTLKCKVVPPSGEANASVVEKSFVFDNQAPVISAKPLSNSMYSETQTISVSATDASGVKSAYAQIVTPNGSAVDGCEEFELESVNGIVSQNVNINNIPSGAYALKVRAVDENGLENVGELNTFYIRNDKPQTNVSFDTKLTHQDKQLISSADYTLKIDVSEAFANASATSNQNVYYRVSSTSGSYGNWVNGGAVAKNENSLSASILAKSPVSALVDGENTLYVQTAIAEDGTDTSKIDINTIQASEISFYYDETAPNARLIIEDVHTSDGINGKVYLSDNLDAELKLTSPSDDVTVTRAAEGGNEFNITVNKCVDINLVAEDVAGNKTNVPLVIKGIDTEAPTATISTQEVSSGDRIDGKAVVNVYDAQEDEVQIALIPENEYSTAMENGKIKDTYFNNYNTEILSCILKSSTESEWEEERNLTYEINLIGATAKYYVGIRMADSLGNETERIFSNGVEVLSATDAELSLEHKVLPKKAGAKAIVKLNFNVPAYVLPQDKIVTEADTDDQKDIDKTNLEIAKQNATSYSQSQSFIITNHGTYKVYAVDDIGRSKMFKITVTDDDVLFNQTSGLETKIYVGENHDIELADDEMTSYEYYIPYGDYGETLVNPVVHVKSSDPNMYLYPYDKYNNNCYESGFMFDSSASQQYEVKDAVGYTELVYTVIQALPKLNEYYYDYMNPYETTERMLDVYVFEPGTPEEAWSQEIAVVNNIDNTPPKGTVDFSPNIIETVKDESVSPSETPGSDYVDKITYTPSDVTATVTLQDAETGIEKINLGGVKMYAGIEPEEEITIGEIPLKNSKGEYIDYTIEPWTWNGEKYGVPVTIEYSGDADPKGIKTLRYLFTDNVWMDLIECYNTIGNREYIGSGRGMEGMTTRDCIYKMPIEEGLDYSIEYYYEDNNGEWQPMTDSEAYYRRVKAVITPGERAEERELKISNNNGAYEKILDSYENTFTFKLKDKYGYKADVTVSHEYFDEQPGEIRYSLSTTQKTNEPITVQIQATDELSGVGEVKLLTGNEEIAVTDNSNGNYSASIAQNGTYSIVMYDKVGNKAVTSFNVGNIDSEVPTITNKIFSTQEVTTKSVSVSLQFSKPNVKITAVEPLQSSGDEDLILDSKYSVNYSTSVITFTDSGTLTVIFKDEYGNEGIDTVTVSNIDRTPPSLSAVTSVNENKTEVKVTFEKAKKENGEIIDKRRKLSDIYVMYGGIAQRVETVENDTVVDKAEYVFCENGIYTFKVYDGEGASSFVTLEIKDIDLKSPIITQIRWSYGYDLLENGEWKTKSFDGKYTPGDEAGYVFATDKYPVTNQDVTVTVTTDDATRPIGSSEDVYNTENEKVYTDNGMYIFNLEKNNRLTDSYGVDIELIDKKPPVIDLLGKNELIFYENSSMGDAYSKDYLTKPGVAFNAYDEFGNGTDLNSDVTVKDWGGFNPDNLKANTFDSSSPYTIVYQVSDKAHNVTEAKRTVRLVGMYDTIALVNGQLPDYAGRCEVRGKDITVSLKNISTSATSYVRYDKGMKTMGEMKKSGTMISKNSNGDFTVPNLESGWYTFYVQTDKRDYFTLQIYLYN